MHFLNMVDEADLMALVEGEGKKETTVMPQTCICKEKCEAGAVNESCPVCLNNRSSCIGVEQETEPEKTGEPEQPKDSKGTKSLLLLFLLILFAGGGAFYYLKYVKQGDVTAKGSPDLSDFDFDEYEDEEPPCYEGCENGTEEVENGLGYPGANSEAENHLEENAEGSL